MDLTPVKIRGKRHARNDDDAKRKPSSTLRKHVRSNSEESTEQRTPLKPVEHGIAMGASQAKRRKITRQLSSLENLPNELLHDIFLMSMNIELARASPTLVAKLSNAKVMRDFGVKALIKFLLRTNGKVEPSEELRAYTTLRKLFDTKWCTWSAYRDFCQDVKAESIISSMISDRPTTDKEDIAGRMAMEVPIKLLKGPWDDAKATFLYLLVSQQSWVDWEGSLTGELASKGLLDAVEQGCEQAVAALAALAPFPIDVLKKAVMECGCKLGVVFHLIWWIVHRPGGKGDMSILYDAEIWAWADNDGGGKGKWLKDMLRGAAREQLSWDFWRHARRYEPIGRHADQSSELII